MIFAIGEILIDTFVTAEGIERRVGGAPFNLAVHAKQCGAEVVFCGSVGRDDLGRMARNACDKAHFDCTYMFVDRERNTTEAVVTLKDGERSFKFNRDNTADYHINIDHVDLDRFEAMSIMHVGSLMLSQDVGRQNATIAFKKAREKGVKISFDVNFRLDLYKDEKEAVEVYKPYVRDADIVKFAEDEILVFADECDLDKSIERTKKSGQLLVITRGSKGSIAIYDDVRIDMPTTPLTPVDTTGAGDAFFGAFLASIDGKEWTEEVLKEGLILGNKKGAETTQYVGAFRL